MPRHEDLTANVQRTAEELVRIRYSLDEIDSVIDGYPQLDARWQVPLTEQLPGRRSVILGREVNIYDIPSGYDATQSSYRQSTIERMSSDELLHGEPDPDLLTGGDWQLPEDHPTVRRALRDRCRDFTQHRQPLVPGWKELLSLPMGMPTGIGWYTHMWLSDMTDSVTYRLSKNRDDLEVLLYPRPGDSQSESVFATPGGYVVKADTQVPGQAPLQAATARRTMYWAGRDISEWSGVPVRVKYPISSGNTIIGGLKTTPYARFITEPEHEADPTVHPVADATQRAAGFVSLKALAEHNPTGGSSGKNREGNPFPIWTTHFEYVVAGLESITDPENQYRFGMSSPQFAQVREVVEYLEENYPMLQPV